MERSFEKYEKMIEDYRGMAVFVAVADAGSFSEAGRGLNLTPAAISHHIGKLERKLGISLFLRSTRALVLTPQGEKMLEHARRMVVAANEALDSVADLPDEPSGALRVTTTAFGDNSPVRRAIFEFAALHGKVSIDMQTSDTVVDIVKDRFDLAIRLGDISGSGIKSQKIGEFHRVLVAAPSYLAKRSPIKSPEDLLTCDFIDLSMVPPGFSLTKDRNSVEIEPSTFRIKVNSVSGAKSAICAGLGVLRLPSTEVEKEIAQGEMVRVLPDWQLPVQGIYAVWPDTGQQKRLTGLLIDYLSAATR